MPAPVTFAPADDADATAVVTALEAAGFVLDPPEWVRRTVLDTFDGRLHGAGLRLELVEQEASTLVLRGGGATPAHLAVDVVPSLVGDLPAGPFRSRLAPVLDIRALLAHVSFGASLTRATQRDADGKVRVAVTLHEELEVEDAVGAVPSFVVEVEGLTGYDKAARRASDLLSSLGLVAREGELADLAATVADVDLAGFAGSPTVRLDADAPALDAYRRVLANLADTVDGNWQGTIDDLDPEFLHDLRVAVRRTRSVVSQGKRVLPAEVRERFGAEFKWLGGVTGPARDLDVYVIEWDGYVAPLGAAAAALAPVLDHLEAQRQGAYVALGKQLRSRRSNSLMKSWRTWLEAEGDADAEPGRDAGRRTQEVVTARITAAHDHLVSQGRLIDADSPGEALHDLRKDAKKLRYLLECFGGLFETSARKAFVQRLKALQDNLGEHQDAEVHAEQLRTVAEEIHGTAAARPDTLLAMGELTAHLHARRSATREEFAGRFAAFDTSATQATLDDLLASVRSGS